MIWIWTIPYFYSHWDWVGMRQNYRVSITLGNIRFTPLNYLFFNVHLRWIMSLVVHYPLFWQEKDQRPPHFRDVRLLFREIPGQNQILGVWNSADSRALRKWKIITQFILDLSLKWWKGSLILTFSVDFAFLRSPAFTPIWMLKTPMSFDSSLKWRPH